MKIIPRYVEYLTATLRTLLTNLFKANDNENEKLKQKKKLKQQKYRAKRALKARDEDAVRLDVNVVNALRSYIKQIDQSDSKKADICDKTESFNLNNAASTITDNETDTNQINEAAITTECDETIGEEVQCLNTVTSNEPIITDTIIDETDAVIIEDISNIEETNIQLESCPFNDALNDSLKNGLLISSINNRINRFGYIEYEISIELMAVKDTTDPKNSKMVILRRYNDFYVLNALLIAAGVENLPALPRRQFFKFFKDEKFLNDRQQALDAWLKIAIKLFQYQSEGVKNLIKTFLSNTRSNSSVSFLSQSSCEEK